MAARDQRIAAARAEGQTYRVIAQRHGLSIERIRQICDAARRRAERDRRSEQIAP